MPPHRPSRPWFEKRKRRERAPYEIRGDFTGVAQLIFDLRTVATEKIVGLHVTQHLSQKPADALVAETQGKLVNALSVLIALEHAGHTLGNTTTADWYAPLVSEKGIDPTTALLLLEVSREHAASVIIENDVNNTTLDKLRYDYQELLLGVPVGRKAD